MLIGIVGKPSSGKSTFFKAATLAEVEIANYPFTTIKPNHATGYVKIDCVEEEFNVKTPKPRMGRITIPLFSHLVLPMLSTLCA